MSFRDEDIAEAFAESVGGRREYFGSDGYSFRRLAKLRDADFDKKLVVLRAVKWNRAHPERRAAIAKTYWSKTEIKARANANARARRAKKPKQLITCAECRERFGRRRGPVPKFCSERCRQRATYQQRTPGARRIAPRFSDPTARKARRLFMQAEWRRKQRSSRSTTLGGST